MRIARRLVRRALAGAMLCCCGAVAAQTVRFHVTLADPPGETQPLLGGINAHGHMAGAAILPGKIGDHALLLSPTRFVDLGTLGGRTSFATAVNDSDTAVGTSTTATGADHAFVWQQGRMTDLGTLPGGGLSQAEAINADGEVAGFATVAGALNHAFVDVDGTMLDIGTLPGADESAARGINDAGHVVGDSGSGGATHAFFWNAGVMTDLGAPGGPTASSAAVAINQGDAVVGAAWDTADGVPVTATLWSGGAVASLGMPADAGATSSYARAINVHGIVVGTFTRPQAPLTQGAFISDGTRIANLEDLLDAASAGWAVYTAMGIDDAGKISALVWDGAAFHFAVLAPVGGSADGL